MNMQHVSFHAFELGRVLRLARKELREILRDRRTVLTLIAMPVLLYPLMSVVFLQFTLASKITNAAPVFHFGVLTPAERAAFETRFRHGAQLHYSERVKAHKGKASDIRRIEPEPLFYLPDHIPRNEQERAAQLEIFKERLREKAFDAVIVIPDLDSRRHEPVERYLPCQFYVMPNNPNGIAALKETQAVFAAANAEDLKERLNVPGIHPHINELSVRPIVLEGSDGIISLAALVPLILILMTITGAVYPAIDLTAGERERGTLEILVAAPVPRFELLTAKYLSVLAVALLTALVNLACMAITLRWSGMASTLFGEQELAPATLAQILGLLFLFAAFFSAVLLCLTSFARSFKEAQAYLIPLMLASLAPGVMAMLPGLRLDGVLTVLPLVNIVLMARDLFEGGVEPGTAAVVILTTLFYALAALGLAARVFGAESVLYSEQSSWADLLRRPQAPRPHLSIAAALWCLALMVPIQFSLFALVRSLGADLPPAWGIVIGVAVNLLLFGALPGLFAYLGRLDLTQALGLAMRRPTAWVAAVFLGASLWPLELRLLAENGYSQALQERFGAVLENLKEARQSVGYGVLALVIVPAILEEIFFRGLLWSALTSRCGPLLTIAVSGLLFGATHVILDGAFGLERLVPSTLLGLILGTVRWRAACLWPSMIVHVLHNTILLLVGLREPGATENIPWEWLAGGVAGAAAGATLLWGAGASRAASK